MAILQSVLFSSNARLQKAANSHAFHIANGSKGDHVVKIQTFLLMSGLVSDDGSNSQFGPPPDETVAAFTEEAGQSLYGNATEFFVQKYKQDNDIIDHGRQDQADGIAGVLTIRFMDKQQSFTENLPPPLVLRMQAAAVAPANLKSIIAAGPSALKG